MNDEQLAFWQQYARTLADLLGLKDRDIVVERNPPTDADALAYIWCHSDTVNAHIYLSSEFLGQLTPERQRCVVAHELMHIHTTPYDDQVRWMLDHLPQNELTSALPTLVRTEVERLTDRLAYIVAPFLPLPGAATEEGEIGPPCFIAGVRPATAGVERLATSATPNGHH